MAFMDVRPVNPGHMLVIPKLHSGYVFDLPEPDYSELFQRAQLLTKPLQSVTQAKRIGLAVEGFGVDHVHVHLIPINNPGELDPGRAHEADPTELQDIAQRVAELLN